MGFKRSIGIAILAIALGGANVEAGAMLWATPAGSKDSVGEPVSAQALFTFKTNEIDVTLTNLLVDPKSVGQNLSGLIFTLHSTATGDSLSSGSGALTTVFKGGAYTTPSPTSSLGWVFSSSGKTISMDVLTGTGHAGPAHTLLGSPGKGGLYDNANRSIAGNGPHNKFLVGPVTFVFKFNSGVTPSSIVDSVTLQFGTSDGDNHITLIPTVDPPIVPEPASIAIWGVAGLGVVVASYRRQLSKRRLPG